MPERPSASGRSARRDDWHKLAAMMAMFFLVVCAVGILRPIRNALALDGLGSTDFYKVYLVSAVVVFFVPAYNRLADRVPWRLLIPAVAMVFAANLLIFRLFYREGSTTFGLLFYGWYDLFAAALVTQFFMATQLFFDARLARTAYPVVIAGGSLGATLGGAITGFFAARVGTPNLLIVAAGLILLFSIGLPLVWTRDGPDETKRPRRGVEKLRGSDMRNLLADRQVRLIAGMVLITILVKQLVDYEFNTLSKQVFVERDAISAFQGKFNAATQWLPIVVLAALQPALRRWGIGMAVMLLPIAMLFTNLGLLLFFGLGGAVAAKGAETALRYSAERAGREILYVPIAPDIKLKAKTYIDVAVEKGIGKVASAGLIFVLLLFMDHRWIPAVAVVLAAFWIGLAFGARKEYVRALSKAIQGRFASLHGVLATLVDATTLPVLTRALETGGGTAAFALDLLEKSGTRHAAPIAPALHGLFEHESPDVRARAVTLAAHLPGFDAAASERLLLDPDPSVREAAVRARMVAQTTDPAAGVRQLLNSPHPQVRTAVLACIARAELGAGAVAEVRARYTGHFAVTTDLIPPELRIEMAYAGAALGDADAARVLDVLLVDPDPEVAAAALHGAGLVKSGALDARLIDALASPATREAARNALARQGTAVIPSLTRQLLDRSAPLALRRVIPTVLARIPAPETVEALVRCARAPETEQILDYRVLKALSKLRARHPDLVFDTALVQSLLERELDAAAECAAALGALAADTGEAPAAPLLRRALQEAWRERREGAFRALGLVHSPDDVYRCFLAVTRGERVPRANALEWLENTLGHGIFVRLSPVLEPVPQAPKGQTGLRALDALAAGEDVWIAALARRMVAGNGRAAPASAERNEMDAIEKVMLLQRVDLLRDARTAHLALLASIADEIDVEADTILVREGEPASALHVVVEGQLALRGAGGELTTGPGTAVGAWSLIDEAPSIVEARASGPARLLRIGREEFYDLLTDYPELAIGIMQGLAGRMRALVA